MNSCHFKELLTKGYNLDVVFLLQMVERGESIKEFCNGTPKLEVLLQTIIRKQLITDDEKLTLEGKSIIAFINSDCSTEIPKQERKDNDFDRWWKAYPATDTFKHKGKTFTGDRALRVKKDDCKVKIKKIIAEGEYGIEQMIGALEYEIIQKKENSIKTNSNKLSFMQNSLTYLNQRTFEPFIELIKDGFKVNEKEPTNYDGVNI